MSWALKGLNGPLKDMLTPLKPGMTLGRQGDLVIQDGRASTIHARITQTGGTWAVEDNNSKNGVRVNGQKVAWLELKPGTQFQIAGQMFAVTESSISTEAAPKKTAKGPDQEVRIREVVVDLNEAPTTVAPARLVGSRPPELPDIPTAAPADSLPLPPPVKKQRKWNEVLVSFLESNGKAFNENQRPVAPLEPALVLDFIRGIQVNSRWVVGYGPRKVGAAALDLPIWEPGAPALCFEILPSTEGIVFKTAHPDMVKLNGESVDNQVLRVGDTIRISETIIEVDFIE